MSSRHSDLITALLLELPASTPIVSSGRGSDAVPPLDRTQMKAADRKPFRRTGQRHPPLEGDIRAEEHCGERARIVHESHATLFQGFHASSGLEQAFSNLLSEVTNGRGRQLRIFVQGEPRTLNPRLQEQLILIGREAVINALRHSEATEIELEVQYLSNLLRVLIRDNGCGINPEAVQKESDSHCGLQEMRERAENIGARFGIWSRTGAGTEVRVAVPVGAVKRTTHDRGPWESRWEI